MKLHRVSGKPDWESVPLVERNGWQILAARTSSIVTPGNFFTLIGLIGVGLAMWLIAEEQYLTAAILLVISRLLDLLDGWLADVTGTKSPLGEFLDATVDKTSTFLTLLALLVFAIAPWWVLVLLLVPHVLISIVAFVAKRRKIGLHPSQIGKLSMAATWLALPGFLLEVTVSGKAHDILAITAYASVVLAILGSYYALWEYTQQTLRKAQIGLSLSFRSQPM